MAQPRPESLAAAPAATGASGAVGAVMATATIPVSDPQAPERLAAALGPGPFSCVIYFVSPDTDVEAFARRFAAALPGAALMGCTTAGEISPEGYAEGEAVAIALSQDHFAVDLIPIHDLARLRPEDLIGRMIRARSTLMRGRPGWDHEFAFLVVDGLSVREDALTAALAPGLGPVPLFGGSAGDGTRFQRTLVIHGAEAMQDAAVLAMVRTDCRARVFSLDHLRPTERRMVVTEADPARRIVRQINAEPAAREYARLLGLDPWQLDTFTFAAHPVVVRIGGKHHVRAIQQVAPNGDLVFFSAIDEGVVLTLAEPQDMVAHLDHALAGLAQGGAPAAVLACDCILRRMEAMEKQRFGALSEVLRKHRVLGFSTYGEQVNSMHVNQTMTGVALYPPDPAA